MEGIPNHAPHLVIRAVLRRGLADIGIHGDPTVDLVEGLVRIGFVRDGVTCPIHIDGPVANHREAKELAQLGVTQLSEWYQTNEPGGA